MLLTICSVCSCKHSDPSADVKIECIQTIVLDTIYSPKIAVLCKFTNRSEFNVCFGNRYYQETDDISTSGLILSDDSFKDASVNLGSILHSKYFVVPKYKSRHLIFIFSPILGDSAMRNKYNMAQNHYYDEYGIGWPFQLVKNCKFKYLSWIDNQTSNKVSNEYQSVFFIDSLLIVNRKDSLPKYNDILSEDARRMIIKLDSLSDLKSN